MTTPDPRTLAADLYARYGAPVVARLRRRHTHADPQWCWDAFIDAVLHDAGHVDHFDPARGSRGAFLAGIADRRLQTRLRGEARRRRREREKVGPAVTEAASAAKSPLEKLADRELAEAVKQAIARTPQEQQALALWLRDAEPAEFAIALSLTELPDEGAQPQLNGGRRPHDLAAAATDAWRFRSASSRCAVPGLPRDWGLSASRSCFVLHLGLRA
jgi:DNA-directed RNA polymerase specialized sigma24 family protein